MEAQLVLAGGVIFFGIVGLFVYLKRKDKKDTSGDGSGSGGKDEPPRTDGPSPK